MSPTTNPSVCRYCNARRLPDQGDGVIRFACGTTAQVGTNKTISQYSECMLRIELTSALDENESLSVRLEAANADVRDARARIAELEREPQPANDSKYTATSVKANGHVFQVECCGCGLSLGWQIGSCPECRETTFRAKEPPTATPLDRPNEPGWWWNWSLYEWEPHLVCEYENGVLMTVGQNPLWDGKWLPATPPPVPGGEGVGG